MLQRIRELTQGWIAGTIIILLILSFALWGIHSYFAGGAGNNSVATVNNIEITQNQLTRAYERLQNQMQAEAGSKNELSPTVLASLKNRALQSLIEFEVLRQASIKQNYRISDQQVDNYLLDMPELQVDGHFSQERFQRALAVMSYSIADFLNSIKSVLLIDQPRLGIIFSSFAQTPEVQYAIQLVNQQRLISYLLIPNNYLLKTMQPISSEQIHLYYQAHQDEYRTPEQVSVEYLTLNTKDLAAKIKPTDKELQAFYQDNLNLFTPAAKHNETATAAPFAEVKSQVEQAYARQKAEEQFVLQREKLANITYEHPESLQPAASSLGLTIKSSSLFSKLKGTDEVSNNPKVREAAFSDEVLQLKNNSDVINLDPNTVVVIRLKSHIAAAPLPLANVAPQIKNQLQAVALESSVAKLAEDLQKELNTGTDPRALALQYHLAWTQPVTVERQSAKIEPAIVDVAFQMTNPTAKQPVPYSVAKVPNGYAIIALHKVTPGQLSNHNEYNVFAEQVQNAEGLLEYELYKESLMKQAKIVVNS